MPKKSKREKILADLRRKAYTEQSLTAQIPTLVKEEPASVFRFQAKQNNDIPLRETVKENLTELTAIKRDLYKTFILAMLAIAAEIIIYWIKR